MNNNNKLLLIVLVLTIVMVGVSFGGNFFIDKVADRIIQKLQKEYSPSPYGPGINPDKIDVQKLLDSKNSNNWNNSWHDR